jgi:hypothetical protein
MNFAARIADGLVVEVVELPFRVEIGENGEPVTLPEHVPIDEAFHPDAGFVVAPADVVVGMRFVDGEFLPPVDSSPPTDNELKEALIAYLKDRRWRVENAGIVAIGVPIATDDRSKMMLIGSRLAAMAAPETYATPWAALDGTTHQFDAAQMIAVSDTALAHVQACFSLQGELWGAIEAGTITTTQEIDEANWPATVT